MIPIKNNKDLFRDEKTNAIINCSDVEYNNYIKLKRKKMSEKEELEKIKSDIEEIKNCIKLLAQKINT